MCMHVFILIYLDMSYRELDSSREGLELPREYALREVAVERGEQLCVAIDHHEVGDGVYAEDVDELRPDSRQVTTSTIMLLRACRGQEQPLVEAMRSGASYQRHFERWAAQTCAFSSLSALSDTKLI